MGKGLHSIICLLLALAISAKGQGAAPASTAPTPAATQPATTRPAEKPAATQPATTQPAEKPAATIDSLLHSFDSQNARGQLGTSGAILDILTREGFIDEPVCIPAQAKPDSVRALTWYWAGEWYYDLQDYQRAMHYGQKAMKLCRKAGDPLLEADCANLLSIICFRQADYPHALQYARRTLEIGREHNDISRISYALNTLAGICLASRRSAEGEQYILEAIRLCEQSGDSVKLAVRCGMASEIYLNLGRNALSLEYSQRAYDIDSALGRADKAAIRLSQMAAAYLASGETLQAQACLEKAIPVLQAAGNLQSLAISCNLMGEICLAQADMTLAAEYFGQALDIFSQKGDAYGQSKARLGLSKALMDADPAESARQLMLYSSVRDSLYDSEMNRGLNEMNARYRSDALQADRDLYRRRTIGLVVLLALLLAGGAVFAFVRIRRRGSLPPATDPAQTPQPGPAAQLQTLPASKDEAFMEVLEGHIRDAMQTGKVDFEDIASKMCISRTHLNRKVKAITGGTTSELVQSLRLYTAKNLLLTTDLPVWEIAHRCGIDDPTYFSTLFKKATGKTPVQFRNEK